ncbi:hypothetical protein [Streptomyces sp. NPDC096012]|uniref:hypothetical protein n=1 Tax=Streptomyces sp. NPDC096012 TaxID=3155684 RepID=UPI00336A5869
MRLTKRFATISAAATAAVLFSAGGAQAQGSGGLLSLLSNTPLLKLSYPVGQVKQSTSKSTSTSTKTTSKTSTDTQNNGNAANNNNNNNNNNNGGAANNNNNNNNNNGGGANNNNNNNNNGAAATTGGGLLSLLNNTSLLAVQVCYPTGQSSQGNNTFTGNQNINCNQS